ncbi:MAG: hypothetical protein ABI821_06505 [Pseudomonadota bacterium]
MHIHPLKTCAIAFVAALLCSGSAKAADEATPAHAEKWRIDCNGHATDDGQVQFRVTPHEGEAILVTAKIFRGRGEHFVAQDMLKAFKDQLPRKRFGAEIVASQQVLVKPRPGEPEFTVEIVEAAVPGMHFHVTKG